MMLKGEPPDVDMPEFSTSGSADFDSLKVGPVGEDGSVSPQDVSAALKKEITKKHEAKIREMRKALEDLQMFTILKDFDNKFNPDGSQKNGRPARPEIEYDALPMGALDQQLRWHPGLHELDDIYTDNTWSSMARSAKSREGRGEDRKDAFIKSVKENWGIFLAWAKPIVSKWKEKLPNMEW